MTLLSWFGLKNQGNSPSLWQKQVVRELLKQNTQVDTPLQLPNMHPVILSSNGETIKVEDGWEEEEEEEENGFDLLCYENEESIQGYRNIKWREVSERVFSQVKKERLGRKDFQHIYTESISTSPITFQGCFPEISSKYCLTLQDLCKKFN